MLRLLEFLYRRRILALFLFLEGLSLWLLFSFNNRYNTYYLNSSNRVAGEISDQVTSVDDYFNLQSNNKDLARENVRLRHLLAEQALNPDTTKTVNDSSGFVLHLADVVNASFMNARNYVTLRIDPNDDIKPGMGVVSSDGIVGRVKSVSKHFATVTSLLNSSLMVSSRVKGNGALCTVQWDGEDPLTAELKFVPRHLNLAIGDTVMTSGFGSVFPEDYLIGFVQDVELRSESAFYDARVRLATDFTRLHTAYIVEIRDKQEKLELEEEVIDE